MGTPDFENAAWAPVAPQELTARRGNGRHSFGWYRLDLTLPEKVGSLDLTGAAVVFETVVDDYAEIWVDGKLPLVLGQAGGNLVHGFNAPNRVVIARDAQPGQTIHIAVFAANGPLSAPPGNFIWMRAATLDLYRPGRLGHGREVATEIVRRDPALDTIVSPGTKIELLATGFSFTEGPVWVRDGGYLLFSDPNENTIYRYSGDGQVSIYRTHSGYTGVDLGVYHQPGSNGLTIDREGRLTIDEHGNRRVTRLEKNGTLTVLADRFEGKRLNSPNDLVYRSDDALYFTDPPFGLPKVYDDPGKELPTSGVFLLHEGRLKRVADELKGPNGLAFSPDEKFLYVSNWDEKKKVVLRYPVAAGGTLGAGTVFIDLTPEPGEEALDGFKVDTKGNVYLSGPGGLWIFSTEGKTLGIIKGPELAANFAFGDEDGKALYLTARTGLYRIRLNVEGIRP
ncbi:MAG: SMP-30/gluconolactonase/LRE family protein [Acidobacteriota bacterium]